MRAATALAIAASAIAAVIAMVCPAAAQSLDGIYAGAITCEAIAGTTQRPLRGSLKLTVSGAKATYEREIQSRTGQPTGQFERGNGSVTPTGAVTLNGSGQVGGSNVTATYSGAITGGVARLTGSQRWTLQRGGPDAAGDRKCTIVARIGQ
jgi:hypothetical protein